MFFLGDFVGTGRLAYAITQSRGLNAGGRKCLKRDSLLVMENLWRMFRLLPSSTPILKKHAQSMVMPIISSHSQILFSSTKIKDFGLV